LAGDRAGQRHREPPAPAPRPGAEPAEAGQLMPTVASQHVAPFQVKVDGVDLDPDLKGRLPDIKVRQSLRQPSTATIKIGDPKAEYMDKHPLQIGCQLQILLGESASQTTTKVFDGEIGALEPAFDQNGASIGVVAYAKSHR